MDRKNYPMVWISRTARLMAALILMLMISSVATARPGQSPENPSGKAQSGAQGALDHDATIRKILGSVVGLRSFVSENARTAGSLGTERQGTAIVINDEGLLLTIGYLILEADRAEIVMQDGTVHRAKPLAYDHDTGFGLLQTLAPIGLPPATLGSSADLVQGSGVISVAMGGPQPITPARVVSRREFAGYWEYYLKNAIFASPPNPFFGGAALFDARGELVGIGSLIVNDAAGPDEPVAGNMFIPIDALKPVLTSMIETGRGPGPRRPWLGVYTTERNGRLFITKVAIESPAAAAGLKPGDVIFGAGGRHISNMAEFYQRIWSQGSPGADVVIDVLPHGSEELEIKKVTIRSEDRYDWLRLSR